MCGVAAIFSFHYASPAIDQGELRTIRDQMIRRGPDGKGEWFSTNGRVALGHRRLSIIDLSEQAAQPMLSEDGQLAISFNGEIYNYEVLRAALEKKGCHFRSHSDTEVLLHLYAEKGEAMVHDLRGMFAFVIWDQSKKALFMARDPYGIKPLYYANDGWTIRVASQVKAILAGGKVSQDPETAGIVGFYLLGSVPEPWTTYQGIHALPAGSTLWVTEIGPSEPQQYFNVAKVWRDAEPKSNQLDLKEKQRQVREALLDSVRHHLVADVPVGIFLSAGIDSSVLTALISETNSQHSKQQHKIKSITLAFEEFKNTESDESPLAERVAQSYGTEHTTRYVTEDEFHQDLPAILDAMDQPTIDGINTWFVAKAAKEQGLKVVISGIGGDELFGGYPSFGDLPRWVRRMAIPSRVPLLGEVTRRLIAPLIPRMGLHPKAAGMLKYGGYWHTAWFLRRGLFMPWELEKVMKFEQVKTGLARLNLEKTLKTAINPEPDTTYGRVAAMETALYMRNQLLRDADWAGMAHSLEIRVPLVDSVLLLSLAGILKTGGHPAKQLLANTPQKVLPKEITARGKTGFTTPIEKWQKCGNGKLIPLEGKFPGRKNVPWARSWALKIHSDFSRLWRNLIE